MGRMGFELCPDLKGCRLPRGAVVADQHLRFAAGQLERDRQAAVQRPRLSIAQNKCWLSGEHFSVDGTLIQACAGHKSFVRRDDDQDPEDGGSFKGEMRSNETHES
jgi:hypothetical protein